MNRLLLLALAVLAACALFLVLQGDGGAPDALEASERSAASSLSDAAPALGDGDAAGSEEQRSATRTAVEPALPSDEDAPGLAVDLEEARFLEGRVIDDRDEPLAGAWVMTAMEAEPGLTDEDGRFRLPLREVEGWGDQRQVYAWSEGREFGLASGPWEQPFLIRLGPDTGMEIQVVRKGDESPIAGAEGEVVMFGTPGAGVVQNGNMIWHSTPVPVEPSDREGVMRVPSCQQYFGVVVRAAGYDDHLAWVSRRNGEGFAAVVQLRPAAPTLVRFIDGDGGPVAGAQVDFGQSEPASLTDEQGWAEVPPLARSGFWSLRVERGPLQWADWQEQDGQDSLLHGKEFIVDHRPREGRLDVNGRGAAPEYEIATCAEHERWGVEYAPDPNQQPSLLHWAPVAEDGAFEIDAGWQGRSTAGAVRRAADRQLVLLESLEGPGPYVLSLPGVWPARLVFQVEPAAYLDGAVAEIQPRGSNRGSRSPLKRTLVDGAVACELEAGEYRVRIALAGQAQSFQAGSFTMPEAPHEQLFDLGRMRVVRGRVTAGERPLYPCTIQISGPDRFSRRTTTGEDGRWAIDGLPSLPLTLRVTPSDPWLTYRGNTYDLPPGLEEFDVEIPVARLRIEAGDPLAFDLGRSRVTRARLPESGGIGRPMSRSWRNRLRLPDLSEGPAEIRVAPSVVQFHDDDPFSGFTPADVELRAGDLKSVTLRRRAMGVLAVTLVGANGSEYRANVRIDGPGESSRSVAIGRQSDGLSALSAWKADPGEWRVRLRGPIRHRWRRNEQPFAPEDVSWQGTVPVTPGRRTILELKLLPDGKLEGVVR